MTAVDKIIPISARVRINVTDEEGTLLGEVWLEPGDWDLTNPLHHSALGYEIADAIGGDRIKALAQSQE